jgi:salicylate hydroxylase
MGPGAHLVAYPISGARRINVVAIVPGTWNRPGWSAPGDGLELKSVFGASRWPGPARMMLGAVDDWRRWALFTVPESGRWYDGTIGLLGDAVHAMLPFAAQGAGMAIEDAAVLARVFGDGPVETAAQVTKALRRYRRLRRARVARVQRLAEKQGRIYHMAGPMAVARDLSIRLLGPKHVLARQRWIHDWKI